MGLSLYWMAVKGKTPQEMRDKLGLRPTGARGIFPEVGIHGAELPGGWYLIVWNHVDTPKAVQEGRGSQLAEFSAGAELVTCFVEEHVMCSMATGWKDGRRIWSIIHDSVDGIDDLKTEGDLPPAFASARDEAFSEQEGDEDCDHVFNVPIEVVKSITGYIHERDLPGVDGDPFEELAADPSNANAPKPSLWKKLFG